MIKSEILLVQETNALPDYSPEFIKSNKSKTL